MLIINGASFHLCVTVDVSFCVYRHVRVCVGVCVATVQSGQAENLHDAKVPVWYKGYINTVDELIGHEKWHVGDALHYLRSDGAVDLTPTVTLQITGHNAD